MQTIDDAKEHCRLGGKGIERMVAGHESRASLAGFYNTPYYT